MFRVNGVDGFGKVSTLGKQRVEQLEGIGVRCLGNINNKKCPYE